MFDIKAAYLSLCLSMTIIFKYIISLRMIFKYIPFSSLSCILATMMLNKCQPYD
ncbi:hypothetical protein Hanom_Chr12g01123351 [Helianthus anomalus]